MGAKEVYIEAKKPTHTPNNANNRMYSPEFELEVSIEFMIIHT